MAGEIQVRHMNPNHLYQFKWGILILLLLSANAARAQTSYQLSTCSGDAFSFFLYNTPATTTYTWPEPDILPSGSITGSEASTSPQSTVSDVLVNTTNSPATATYIVTTDSGSVFRLVITVNPMPRLSSTKFPAAICSGNNFIYTPESATASSSFQWSRVVVPGINNSGNQGSVNPNEILTNTTINPIKVIYSYAVSANGCTSYDEKVEVIVNPVPLLTSTQSPPHRCSGAQFDYIPASPNATSFTWQRQAVSGISNPTASGSNGIHEVLVNTTFNPILVTYTYTLANSNQSCASNQLPIKLYVYPVPNVTNTITTQSCSGNTFMVTATNVPVETKYVWSTPTMITSGPPISGGSAESTQQFFVGQALTNNGLANETIRYKVKPIAEDCSGNDFFVDVTVTTTRNSKAELNVINPAAICSGSDFIYQAESSAAVSYAWQRFYSNEIIQSISSSGANTTGHINERLDNRLYNPVIAYYAFTLITANGCQNTQLLSLKVNPATALNSTLTPVSICSNSLFSYSPGSNTLGTAFGWTRAAVTNITNPASSGTNNPMEVLVNTSNVPINVIYRYSMVTGDGCTNTQDVTVTVMPTPRLTSALTPPAICSGSMFNYPHTSSVSGTGYSWRRDATPGIGNSSNSGSRTPSELLTATTVIAQDVKYYYTLFANGCSNNQTVTVTVRPTPIIFSQSVTECSNRTFLISPPNIPLNTLYTWSAPTVDPAGSLTGMTTRAIPSIGFAQNLRNQTINTATALYTIKPSAGTCAGAAFQLSAIINPIPRVGNQVLQPVCSGSGFTYVPSSVPSNTMYTWSVPVQVPFNSLVGGNSQQISQSSFSQVLSSSNNISDTAVYSITPSANGCTGDVFRLTVPVSPVPVVNNILDTICTDDAFSILPGAVPVNTGYIWAMPVSFPFGAVVGGSQQNTPSTTISQILQNATKFPAKATYSVTPVAGNCQGTPFQITIVVGSDLPVFANQELVICGSNSFNATPINAPSGTVYTWSTPTVMPKGAIAGLNAQTTPVPAISQQLRNNSNIADTVVYSIRAHYTGCTGNVFTATVRLLPTPRASVSGNQIICRYPGDSLKVNFTGIAPWAFTYNDGLVEKTVSGITQPDYPWIVPASSFGLAERKLSITAIHDNACNSIDTVYFTQKINPLPVGTIDSRTGMYICNNSDAVVYVSSKEPLTKQWMYNGNRLLGLVSDSIKTLTPGSYNAILTNKYGCIDTARQPLLLHNIATPTVRFVYDSYCVNKQIRFNNLSDTLDMGVIEWAWDFGDSKGAGTYNSTHTYQKGGKHHVKLTARQLFCPANIITADTTLDIQYPLTGIRMPSINVYKRQTIPLAARNTTGYRYEWVPGKGIDNPFVQNPNFNYETTQDYYIHLISTGGCITKDSMLVRVFDENLINIMVPKAFTPNNDGTNDILYPYLSGIKTFHYFRVFNRFGKLLFETKDYDKGWNGSFNGLPQPMGIYLWISVGIANDGRVIERKGQTLLIR